MIFDIYSAFGLLVFLVVIVFIFLNKPSGKAYLILIPNLLFLFGGLVSNSGLIVLSGFQGHENRYLFGAILSAICLLNSFLICIIDKIHSSKK